MITYATRLARVSTPKKVQVFAAILEAALHEEIEARLITESTVPGSAGGVPTVQPPQRQQRYYRVLAPVEAGTIEFVIRGNVTSPDRFHRLQQAVVDAWQDVQNGIWTSPEASAEPKYLTLTASQFMVYLGDFRRKNAQNQVDALPPSNIQDELVQLGLLTDTGGDHYELETDVVLKIRWPKWARLDRIGRC